MTKLFSLFIIFGALSGSWALADNSTGPQNAIHTEDMERCTAQSDPRTTLECWAPQRCPGGYQEITPYYCSDDFNTQLHACGYDCRSIYIER